MTNIPNRKQCSLVTQTWTLIISFYQQMFKTAEDGQAQLTSPTCCCSYWSLGCSAVLSSFGFFCFFCCAVCSDLNWHKSGIRALTMLERNRKKIFRVFAGRFLSRERHASCIPLVQLTVACLLRPSEGWEPFIRSGLQLEASGSPSRLHLQRASAIFILKLTRLRHQPNNRRESWQPRSGWIWLSDWETRLLQKEKKWATTLVTSSATCLFSFNHRDISKEVQLCLAIIERSCLQWCWCWCWCWWLGEVSFLIKKKKKVKILDLNVRKPQLTFFYLSIYAQSKTCISKSVQLALNIKRSQL